MKKIMIALILVLIMIAGCAPAKENIQRDDMNSIAAEVQSRSVFIPVNDIEFANYNEKQRISDDPTTILWCTFFPDTVGQEPFTVPIVGKLTSSGKRPFPESQVVDLDWVRSYNPELVQPDKMYGASTEYRFGFTPAGFYIDFTDLHSYCTNQPTTWQRNKTTLVMEPDAEWTKLNDDARKALSDGDSDKAMEILSSGKWGNGE